MFNVTSTVYQRQISHGLPVEEEQVKAYPRLVLIAHQGNVPTQRKCAGDLEGKTRPAGMAPFDL